MRCRKKSSISPLPCLRRSTTERVVAELKKSFAHIRTAALNCNDADLDRPIKMFGNDTTVRGAFIQALTHLHEHLGQSIAYARINGVVPPWSAR